MPKCGVCGVEVEKLFFRHLREEHPKEYEAVQVRRLARLRETMPNRRPKGSKKAPPSSEAPESIQEAAAGPNEAEAPHRNGQTRDQVGTAVRVQFVQRTVQVDARILLFYNLCRQRFPSYVATEGEWLLDIVSRYFAEHADEFGLDATTMLAQVRQELEGVES